MNVAGQNTEYEGAVGRNNHEFVIWKHRRLQKDEKAVFGCLNSRYVPTYVLQGRSEPRTCLAMNPPVVPVRWPSVLIAFRLDSVENPLIDLWKSCPDLIVAKPK